MHISTVTTKCQTTIPAFDLAHHKALESTLSEWNSEEDKAYDDL